MRKTITYSAMLLLLLLSWGGANAALSGTYTINSGAAASASNYLSVGAAISDLMTGVRTDAGPANGAGVTGPVVLRLVAGSGPYNEQITIGAIAGVSAVNTIRITGGPSLETIQFTGTTTADRQVIKLDGASYIHLDSLQIVNNDATYGFGVHLTNSADNNKITNSVVSVSNTSTSSNMAGIVITGSTATTLGDNGDNNLIQGNLVSGGYYGIVINGQTTAIYGQSNDIIGNTIVDYYYYGIRHYYQNNGEIRLNDLTPRATATTSNYGMYLYRNDNFSVTRNIVHSAGTYGIYAYYANYQNGTGTTRALMANNVIMGTFGSTAPTGIYFSTNAIDVDVFHNSISMTNGNGRCIYFTSGSGNSIQNNILSYENSTTGYGIYAGNASYVATMDYNDVWVPGSSNFVYLGTAYTPATFVGGGGFNTNSLNVVPNFVSTTTDLHIGSGAALYDAGANLGITEDYDGQVRPLAPSTGYDIGADEFTPPLDDAGVAVLASPSVPFAAGVSNVDFEIRNYGLSTLTSATVNWEINGTLQAPYAWTGSVASATNSASFTVGTFNFLAGNTYTVKAWTTLPNGGVDANNPNDTLELSVCVGLSGNYTIGGVGADFPTMTSAVDAMICGGVAGAVNFDFVAGTGPFNEQVTIPTILGASAANTIRFNGGSTMETVQYTGTNTNDRAVIKLNGASFVTLDSMTILNNDPSFSFSVHLTNGSSNNTIQNCHLEVDQTSTSSNHANVGITGLSATTTGNNGDENKILNNEIVGGYYGVAINGASTTSFNFGNEVIGNDIKEVYYYGIRHAYQTGGKISRNKIRARSGGSTAAYGIYAYYNDLFEVDKNDINMNGGYGIYCYYANYQGGTSTGRALITNNMIGGTWGAATPYGIYSSTNGTDLDIWHNSISMTSGNGRALYMTTGSGCDVRNNSFSVSGSASGYAAYLTAAATVTTMNYNNYNCPGSTNFIYIGGAYTPATYIGALGLNSNSKDGDPFYVDENTDLHAFATQLFDAGDPGLILSPDFDDEPRPNPFSVLPDIGADEFLPDSINITTIALLEPTDFICPDSMQVVKAVIYNKGLNAISNISVSAEITGIVTTTLTTTVAGPLNFGVSDTITLGTINTWPGGMLNFKVYNAVPNDQSLLDDTLTTSRSINITPAAPTAPSVAGCMNDSVDLIATATGTQYWYDAMNGGNLLGTGDTLNTGALLSNTTYYVESRGVAPNSLTTTFAGGNGCGGGNMFDIDAYSEITIDSFDVNINSTALTPVAIYYKIGTYLGSETNGAAWTFLDSVDVTGAGTGNATRVPIGGLTIPTGATYAIFVSTNVSYTSLSATYTNGDMQITTGSGLCSYFGGNNPGRTFNGTVYYTAEGCASQRTPVNVSVSALPVVSLNDTSACGSAMLDAGNAGMGYSYLWSTGDTTQMINVTASGTYMVTVSNGNCDAMDSAVVMIANVSTVNLGADTTVCNGASVTLDAGFHNSGSYLWSNGDTTQTTSVTAAGTYYVDFTNGMGCLTTDTIVVMTMASPAGMIVADTAACPMVDFTGSNTGGASTTTAWDFGDGNTGTGATPSHTYTANGTYTVTFTQSNGCGTDVVSMPVTISCLVGVEDGLAAGVQLFPNPTKGISDLHVNFKQAGQATIEIADLSGRIIIRNAHEVVTGDNSFKLDLSQYSAGVYIIRVNAEQLNWQGRLIKE